MSSYPSTIPLGSMNLSFTDPVFGKGLFNPTPPTVANSLLWRDIDVADGWPIAMATAAHNKRLLQKLVMVGPKGVAIGSTPHPSDVSTDPLLCTWTRLIGTSITMSDWAHYNGWSMRNDGYNGWTAFAAVKGPSLRSQKARLEYFFAKCGVTKVDWSKSISIDEITIVGYPYGVENELALVEPPAGECWFYVRTANTIVTRYKFKREGQFRGACLIVIDCSYRASYIENCAMSDPLLVVKAIVDPIMKTYVTSIGITNSLINGTTSTVDTDTPLLPAHPQRVAGVGGFQKDSIVLIAGYVYGWPDMCNCAVVRGDVTIASPDVKPVVSVSNVTDREIRWPGSLLKTVHNATTYDGKPTIAASDLTAVAGSEVATRYLPNEYTVGSNLWASTKLYEILSKAGEDTSSKVMIDQSGDNPAITFASAASKAQGKKYTMMSIVKKMMVPEVTPTAIKLSGNAAAGYTFSYLAIDATAYVAYGSPLDVYADYLNGAGLVNSSTDSRDMVAEIKLQAGAVLADDSEWNNMAYSDKYEFDERAMWSVARSFADMPDNAKAAQQIVQFFQDRTAFAQMSYACIAAGKTMLQRMAVSK